jgi:hypothetical protein
MIKISKQINRPAIYCILGVFTMVLILGLSDFFGINFDKNLANILKNVLLFSLPFLGYWAAIKLPNPEGIEDVNLLPSTKDVKVGFYSTKGFIDRNNQISFVRFFFGEAITYMYFTNYLKIYEGPFCIKKYEDTDPNMFYVKSMSSYTKKELKLGISPKNILNPEYKLILKNLSENDFELIKKYILPVVSVTID